MKTMTKLLVICLVIGLVTAPAAAQISHYPVDVPGTNVHFFLLRYEGTTPPYSTIHGIWERIGRVFHQWALESRDPEKLTPDHVTVGPTGSGEYAVYLKGEYIVTADNFHARINRASSQQLAEKWAVNLREAVTAFVAFNLQK